MLTIEENPGAVGYNIYLNGHPYIVGISSLEKAKELVNIYSKYYPTPE